MKIERNITGNNEKERYTMKSLITVILMLMCSLTFAQPSGGGREGGGPPPMPSAEEISTMIAKVSQELSLTSTQETQVTSVVKAHFSEVESLTSGDQRPDRDEMDALKKSFESDLKEILGDEQAKKFMSSMKQSKGGGKGRPQRD